MYYLGSIFSAYDDDDSLKIQVAKAHHCEDFNLIYLANVCVCINWVSVHNQVWQAHVAPKINLK